MDYILFLWVPIPFLSRNKQYVAFWTYSIPASLAVAPCRLRMCNHGNLYQYLLASELTANIHMMDILSFWLFFTSVGGLRPQANSLCSLQATSFQTLLGFNM